MEIPNCTPLGGGFEDMGDLDNDSMPPMGADAMGGMDDPNMQEPPMDDTNMQEPPIGDSENGEEPNGDDQELMDIINSLSIEDKAAVEKYAKSMADNNNEVPAEEQQPMPMEGKRGLRNIIDETIKEVLNGSDDDEEPRVRKDDKLPKAYKNREMPFKSQY